MKKSFFTTLLLLSLFAVNAQRFDMTSSWTERVSLRSDDSDCMMFHYKIDGDTILRGKHFMKVYRNNELFGAIRESDDAKLYAAFWIVYGWQKFDDPEDIAAYEVPIYDFSPWEVGKRLEFPRYLEAWPDYWTITKEPELVQLLDGNYYQITGREGNLGVIKGIGDVKGIFFTTSTVPYPMEEYTTRLWCFTRGGKLTYKNPLAESCDECAMLSVEPADTDNLTIYPNPFERDICVENSTEELKSLTLFDQSGRRVFQKEVEGINACIEPNLPPGIYALVIETASGKQYSKKIIKQ